MTDLTAHRADITVDVSGNGHIEVGGVDVSPITRGFMLSAAVGEVTRLSLDLQLFRGAVLKGGAVVEVGPETAALLVELGWTPPPASPPG